MNQHLQRKVVNIRAEIELDARPWTSARYGTPEYWDALEKSMEREAKDFHEFIRDHRSRDEYGISIVREFALTCEFCGYSYPDDFTGIADCCDKMIETQRGRLKDILSDEE